MRRKLCDDWDEAGGRSRHFDRHFHLGQLTASSVFFALARVQRPLEELKEGMVRISFLAGNATVRILTSLGSEDIASFSAIKNDLRHLSTPGSHFTSTPSWKPACEG